MKTFEELENEKQELKRKIMQAWVRKNYTRKSWLEAKLEVVEKQIAELEKEYKKVN